MIMTKIHKGLANLFAFLGIVCTIIVTPMIAVTNNMIYFIDSDVWYSLIVVIIFMVIGFEAISWYLRTSGTRPSIAEREMDKYDEMVESKLLSYLKMNKGKAFTVQALLNRMDEYLEDSGAQKYCEKVIEDKLERFFINGEVERAEMNEIMHYLVE
jgi:hypothetical protein